MALSLRRSVSSGVPLEMRFGTTGLAEEVVRTLTIDFEGTAASDAARVEWLRDQLPAPGDSADLGAYGVVRLEEVAIAEAREYRAVARCVYRRWDATAVELRGESGLYEVQTQQDKDGNDLVVSHNGIPQVATMRRQVVTRVLTMTFVDTIADPSTYEIAYLNTLNDDTWRGGVARAWMCTRITYEPVDLIGATPSWRIGVRFELRDDGWDDDVAWVDPATGRPPEGLVNGTGFIEGVEQYGEADFTGLLSAS